MKDIVIIDDELSMLEIISTLLETTGIQCHPFQSGIKALNYIKNNLTDAVLVDMAMPEINGIEVISQLKEKHKNIPIVAMSGIEWKETILQGALIAGADKVLTKPFDFRTLHDTIISLE